MTLLHRPVPISRKRRYSGRLSRPSHSVSEGDMAMADEMGEGEGEEGGDDGFVDCPGGDTVKRRSKKRGGMYFSLPSSFKRLVRSPNINSLTSNSTMLHTKPCFRSAEYN